MRNTTSDEESAKALGLRHLVPGIWRHPGQSKEPDRSRRLFRQSWSLIPLDARRRLRAYWRRRPSPFLLVTPEVRVADHWTGRTPGTLGEVRRQGCLIHLYAPAVRLMPDRPLVGLILHEFAHCYGYAEGLNGHRPGDDLDGQVHGDDLHLSEAEACVEELLESWGVIEYQYEQEDWLASDESAEARGLLRE